MKFNQGEDIITLVVMEEDPQAIGSEYDNIYLMQLTKEEFAVTHELSPNYPNPFNSTTLIQYSVAHTSKVAKNVYDRLDKKVRALLNETNQVITDFVLIPLIWLVEYITCACKLEMLASFKK